MVVLVGVVRMVGVVRIVGWSGRLGWTVSMVTLLAEHYFVQSSVGWWSLLLDV